MADLDQPLASIPRGERGELRVSRRTYRGSAPFIDIRHYYPDEATGELRPGKGVTLREHELRDVVNALLAAVRPAACGDNPRPAAPVERTDAELAEVEAAF